MPKPSLDWNLMYNALLDYKKRFGNCNVPANWRENRQLGRWVSVLRFRHKVEGLPPAQVDKLKAAGFIWSPSALAWNAMFDELVKYRKAHGNCSVPAQWPENMHMASWVANQRHRHKRGTLSADRLRRLEEIGFEWSVYGQSVAQTPKATAVQPVKMTRSEERLYCMGRGMYVQHDGVREMPPELKKYVAAHNGEYPPYFMMPSRATHFNVGDENMVRAKKVAWAGKVRLPKSVLDYVRENGVLPPHE